MGAPVISYFAVERGMGFAMPMMIATIASLVVVVISILLSPETRGKQFTADIEVFKAAD